MRRDYRYGSATAPQKGVHPPTLSVWALPKDGEVQVRLAELPAPPPAAEPEPAPARAARRRRLTPDRKGAIAVMTAISVTALMFCSGLTIDLGLAMFKKRQLQAATDMAAMAAVQNIPNALAKAQAILAANGFAGARITLLTTGDYQANPNTAPSQRYTAGAAPLNAVQLTTSFTVPMTFMRALVPHAQLSVPAISTAEKLDEAGLVAGSGLGALSGGLPNSLLGQMLGTQVSLDLVSYNGLATSQVDALTFLNALATQMNVSAGTYGQLLSGSASVSTILRAEASALASQGSLTSAQLSAVSALQTLAVQASGSPSISLASLISAGVWQKAPVGSIDSTTALRTSINAFQLVTFAAQIANGSNLLAATNVVNIPGVANVTLAISAIEPAQGSYFSLGQTGTVVHTSQIRLLLTATLLNMLSLSPTMSGVVTLPVYVEVANGTAQLTTIACGAQSALNTAGVSAYSGVANAYIGTVSPATPMTNFSTPVTVVPATLVNLVGVMQIIGSGTVGAQGNTQSLTFTQAQITGLISQRVSSTNMLANLLQTLSTSLVLTTSPSNLVTQGLLAVATPLLATLLAPVFASLDSVVDQVLSTLGVQVGYLDVTVPGIRCGVPAVIQ